MADIEATLNKAFLDREDLVTLLSAEEEESAAIYRKAGEVKNEFVGNRVYLRGLLEYSNYLLYENKPCLDEEAEACKSCLEARVFMAGDTIAYGEWGDSRHFEGRRKH